MFEVLFFDNGNTAFIDEDGRQVPKLQKSWILMYTKFLEENGIDPLDGVYKLPAGDAKIFKTKNGYNWRFINIELQRLYYD